MFRDNLFYEIYEDIELMMSPWSVAQGAGILVHRCSFIVPGARPDEWPKWPIHDKRLESND